MSQPVRIINLSSNDANNNQNEDPGQTIIAKFIVVESENGLLFIYGPVSEFSYHARLVKRFCDINSIPSGWARKPDLYDIYSSSHKVRGGGWLEEKPGEKRLRFYGYSTAYGAFDRKDIVHLFESTQSYENYQIIIDD